jgi:hypothetical protein
MGKDNSAPVTNGKLSLPLGSPSGSNNKACLPPGSPLSGASTAASTPIVGFKSPKTSSMLLEPFDLDQPISAMDALHKQGEVGCFLCGESNSLSNPMISYACENPLRSHCFSACLQRCSKKFEKECARLCDTKKKQSGKHADPMNCPRCRSSITCAARSNTTSDDMNSVRGSALPPSPVNAFLPASLLPSKKESKQFQMASTAERQAVTAAVPKPAPCFEELSFQDDHVEDEASKLELKEAQDLVKVASQEMEQLQKELALLSGKTYRKQRNEVNRRIFLLENKADVLAAKRLVRNPVAEQKRRRHEARALEEKAKSRVEMQKVVRARLEDVLRESHACTINVFAFPWEQLLMEGKAAGLADDEEIMIEVKKQVDAFYEEERQKQEKKETAAAAHKYVLGLTKQLVKRLADAEYQKQGKRQKPWRTKTSLPWRRTKFQKGKDQRQGYKTELCRNFGITSCPYGNACFFAHGAEELLPATA